MLILQFPSGILLPLPLIITKVVVIEVTTIIAGVVNLFFHVF